MKANSKTKLWLVNTDIS